MKRGRPPKFGRPARLLAVTLPEDVVEWLQEINQDPAWAIVSLYEHQHRRAPARETAHPDVQLVEIGPRRALIVVPQSAFVALPGVSVVPLGAGRAFLALEPGKGIAELELAVVDRLEEADLDTTEERILTSLRRHLREWRQDKTLTFSARSIIVVERARRPAARTARHR
jgi:hypothetical protein